MTEIHPRPRRNSGKGLMQGWGSEVSIAEEESTYMQECSECEKDFEYSQMAYCNTCDYYYLCPKCYKDRNVLHPDHSMTPPGRSMIDTLGPSMKKISEKKESLEDSSAISGSSSPLIGHLDCQNCSKPIEECYERCLTCEKEGQSFIICADCSNDMVYSHPPDHELAMKTIEKVTTLTRLESFGSNTSAGPPKLAPSTPSFSQPTINSFADWKNQPFFGSVRKRKDSEDCPRFFMPGQDDN